MNWVRELCRRLAMFFGRENFDRDMDEEMRLHLELRQREQAANGLSVEEAYTSARKKFGNALALREVSHDSWGWAWVEHLLQDLKFTFRMLRKSPGFTAVAVLTLALGIGANTAIFSIVDAIFLRSLPFANADRIYLVDRTGNRLGGSTISEAIFVAWQRAAGGIFEHLGVFQYLGSIKLTGAGEAEMVSSAGASPELFQTLGVHAELGRAFNPEDGKPDAPHVAILSESFWRSQFGSDRNVLGRSITLQGLPFTVVGILPREFIWPILPSAPQVWIAVQVPVISNNPSNGARFAVGLLRPEVSPMQAEAALTPALGELRHQFPQMFSQNEKAHLDLLHDFLTKRAGPAPLLLFGAVGLVLLIACANVANLMLARAATRKREMAVRAAIGASRSRIVNQLLTESLILAVLGGALGLVLCYAVFGAILSFVPTKLPHIGDYKIDGIVLLFSFALSVITGIVFGLVPAMDASKVDLNSSLKEAKSQSVSRGTGRIRDALASGEMAISLILLLGAALTIQSLARLMWSPVGFDASNVLTFHVALSGEKYGTAQKRSAFFRQAIERLAVLPGVEATGVTDTLPSLETGSDMLFSLENEFNAQGATEAHDADIRVISSDYFRVLHVSLLRGRMFKESDNASNVPVVVINQAMAKAFWSGSDPIGHRIWIGKSMGPSGAEPAPRQIVGIVSDMRQDSLVDLPNPAMYIPYEQTKYTDTESFVLRTERAPLLAVPQVRDVLRAIDPETPLTQISSMDDVVYASVRDWRFHAILLGIFGVLALLISAVGVYGVISYSVTQRTHEIGVRMALGAQRRSILRLVIRKGLTLAGIGIVVGIGVALGLTRLIVSLLYGVSATDPLTFAGVAVLLLVVAFAACYVPAKRAMCVDPMVALRHE